MGRAFETHIRGPCSDMHSSTSTMYLWSQRMPFPVRTVSCNLSAQLPVRPEKTTHITKTEGGGGGGVWFV